MNRIVGALVTLNVLAALLNVGTFIFADQDWSHIAVAAVNLAAVACLRLTRARA